jgi:hypothetical protein
MADADLILTLVFSHGQGKAGREYWLWHPFRPSVQFGNTDENF